MNTNSILWTMLLTLTLGVPTAQAQPAAKEFWSNKRLNSQAGVIKSEFIYETAPPPSCHASTIVETKNGLVAAWFGGTGEGNPDVGIWVSRLEDNHWTKPVEAATGCGFATNRWPTWNPVLFQPRTGPLMLFYKVGPSPGKWWGMLKTSANQGRTWSEARRLPEGFWGPIKNKPVQLANGDILCPASTEDAGWRVHFERSADGGQTWSKTGAVNDGKSIAATSAQHFVPRRRQTAGDRPHAAEEDLPDRLERRGQDLGPDEAHGSAQSQLRHRRRHAQKRPPASGL